MVTPSNDRDVILPGRLGNPELTLLEDARLDPRVAQVMAQMPPGGPAALLPKVTLTSTYEECLNWVSAMEDMLAAGDAAALAAMPEFADVASRPFYRGTQAPH